MRLPQSKERLGTAILLIATWVLILATVFITRCGSNGSTPPTSDAPTVNDTLVEPLHDTIIQPLSAENSTGNKRKKKGNKKKRQTRMPVRDILGDTVRPIANH